MIDLLVMVKNGLSELEIEKIVQFNKLQTNSKAGKRYYDNMNTKNISDGYYLRIETNSRLKLAVSLHKYKNLIENKGYVNYDLFTMPQAIKAVQELRKRTGIELHDLNVYKFEIGMNLYLSKDCRRYMDIMESIGVSENKRDFFVNPKFKNQRTKTTYFYREMRKYFKVYDKNFEMTEKRRKEVTGHQNILRIETVYNRVENMTMQKFLSPDNIQKLAEQFLKDWRTVKFSSLPSVPKGTSISKQELCAEILKHGSERVLLEAREKLKDGVLTPKKFRRIREFIVHEWETFKTTLSINMSDEEREFRAELSKTGMMLKS